MSARLALLLVVLMTVAGCSAPLTQPAETPQPTVRESPSDRPPVTATPQFSNESTANASTITVSGGELAADPDRVFRGVTQRLGVTVQPPEQIRIIEPDEAQSSPYVPPFLQALGVQPPTATSGLSAQTIGADLIRVNQSIATRPRIEGLLAHEFVHVSQNRREVRGRMFDAGVWDTVPAFGVEQPLLVDSVIEGIATYTADRYQRTATETLPQGTRYGRMYHQRETAGGRYFMAPYWFGYRYVADRLADNETVESIYERPPKTTEAIIHRYEPGAEPPANLSVNVTAEQWKADDRGRVGELGTRMALSANLNVSRAATGADGWGNDVLVPFEYDSKSGYVWVIRWDDSANESEFRAALTTALDRRATQTDIGWRDGATAFRVRQGDDHTTIVAVGAPEFVRTARVTVGDPVMVHGP